MKHHTVFIVVCYALFAAFAAHAREADPKIGTLADTKPLALQAHGLRRAGATGPTTVQVVIGTSITGTAGNPNAYRITSDTDANYAYRDFVRPLKAKILNERKNTEFMVPEGYTAAKGADIRKLTRTVVELELPTALKEGQTYHVIAIGVDMEMVTAAKTAASFTYRAGAPFRDAPENDALGATMVGLRCVQSVGNGIIRLEFGAGYSVPGGNKAANYTVTVNNKPVEIRGMGRRSKIDVYLPIGWPFKGIMQHEVFLDIGAPLRNGDTVRVAVSDAVTCGTTAASMTFSDRASFSSAIKVNQLGYLPDALKLAHSGRWLGSFPDASATLVRKDSGTPANTAMSADALFAKGPHVAPSEEKGDDGHTEFFRSLSPWALRYDAPPKFEVRRADTHATVFTGTAVFNTKGDVTDGRANHSAENSFDLDFTSFTTPGRYYIAIEGVGRSFEFGIAPDIYRSAFETQAYGVFAQRCGQELAPPYSDWERIACHASGVIPTTEKRYMSAEWGKFFENRVMRRNPEGASAALRNAQNRSSLIAHFPFEGDCENRVAGGMALTPVGKPAYVADGAITGGKADKVYATGDDENGFSGTLDFDRTKGATFSFWMRRDDSYSGNKYEGTMLGLSSSAKPEDAPSRLSLAAGWGVLRLLGGDAGYKRVGDNQWRHYAILMSPPNEKNECATQLFVDGELQTRGTVRYGSDDRFVFGRVSAEAARGSFFDELRIYNEVLPPAAIKALCERVSYEVPVVLDTFGGHHDAGDYNPRSHIDVAQTLMNAYEMFPKKFYDGQLNIPEKANGIPDVVDEALWALKLWHGLYDPATGAVYNGTESQGDPNFIQTVELDDKGDYAWAQDSQGAFNYAGTLAQAARILRTCGKRDMADEFIGRAEKAYAWGRANKPDTKNIYDFGKFYVSPLAYAAAQLYHTTGKAAYHDDFLANVPWRDDPKAEMIKHNGYDLALAAYAYAHVPADKADAAVQRAVVDAVKREADMYISGSSKMAYKFIRHPYAPITWGTGAYQHFCMPVLHMTVLADTPAARATYREWLIRSCDNTLGNNPLNLSWVVGIGSQTIRAPLHNSRYSKFGMPVKGMQAEGPYQRGQAYNYMETVYPKHSDSFAIMHAFIDSSFAIAMDEGVVPFQAQTMAVFGVLLPDKE